MKISSPNFENGGYIPQKYTCQGSNLSPALEIEEIPENTKSMAIVVDDPDAPHGDFIHWISYNIPPVNRINEGGHPGNEGVNDFGHIKYDGPCPPKGSHRYRFKVYALDEKLPGTPGMRLPELQTKIRDHIIDSAMILGMYEKR